MGTTPTTTTTFKVETGSPRSASDAGTEETKTRNIHTDNMKTKEALVQALHKFVSQRSGIEWGNYGGSREAFMGDYRQILRDGKDAREMLRYIARRDSITGAMLEQSLTGRLSYRNGAIEYVTGQYFPTEYRAAVCRALAECIWHWLRYGGGTLDTSVEGIRKTAVRCFGRGIARRWFN